MRLVHLCRGPDGRSRFVDRDIEMTPSALGLTSGTLPTEGVFIRDTTGGPQSADFHPAPRRQLVFLLMGRVEYECGDGTKRELGVGDVLLADDLSGQGHRARVIESPRLQVFVPVPAGADISRWAHVAGPDDDEIEEVS
jgi:hypothetical protein